MNMYSDQLRIKNFVERYIYSSLPDGCSIIVKAMANNNLQLTLSWGTRSVVGYVVSGPSGYDLSMLEKQLNNLQKQIPGLLEEKARLKGLSEAFSKVGALGSLSEAQMDPDSTNPKPITFSLKKLTKSAKKYLLTIVQYPFTDNQISVFAEFTKYLAEDIINNGTYRYDGYLLDILDTFKLNPKEQEELLLELHTVLSVLSPSEFIFWMQYAFGIAIHKGMSYKDSKFYYE